MIKSNLYIDGHKILIHVFLFGLKIQDNRRHSATFLT
jgi:hypothetical protein